MSVYYQLFRSQDQLESYKGLVGLRKLLCLENNPPTQEIVDTGLIFDYLEICQKSGTPEVVYEAIYSLHSIASTASEMSMSISKKSGLEIITPLLDSNVHDIIEHAIGTIGHLASLNDSLRTKFFNGGVFDKIVTIFKTTDDAQMKKTCISTFYYFSESKLQASFPFLSKILNLLIDVVTEFSYDEDCLVDIAKTMQKLSQNFKSLIDEMIKEKNIKTFMLLAVLIINQFLESNDRLPCHQNFGQHSSRECLPDTGIA